MKRNPISSTVDFEKDGVQHGYLKLPHSHDESAWGSIVIPISVAKNGKGPTVLFTGANHGDEYAVGSMARFVDGKPDKSGYRKFKIKTVTGRDDFAMINEIVGRRYWRLRKEKSEFPDLIVIDGGKGQLTAALSALKEVGIETPCVSLAKENEEIFIPKRTKSIRISKNKDSIKILQHIRDETHRFGVAYNRSLRKFD